jgi:hypothetical protein
MFGDLMPRGALVRRSFTFDVGEKSWVNRSYRGWVDRHLQRRYQLVDYLFSLAPVKPVERLRGIVARSRHAVVELETHPVNKAEYELLTSNAMFEQLPGLQIASRFASCVRGRAAATQNPLNGFGDIEK